MCWIAAFLANTSGRFREHRPGDTLLLFVWAKVWKNDATYQLHFNSHVVNVAVQC